MLIFGSDNIFLANTAEITGDSPKTNDIMPEDKYCAAKYEHNIPPNIPSAE
jgi:hypothetical protein